LGFFFLALAFAVIGVIIGVQLVEL